MAQNLELALRRTYYPTGTNGAIYNSDGSFICHTIELPWFNNVRKISCIPEMRIEVVRRYTKEKGQHLAVKFVPGRSDILFHTANRALKELLGCIAPVSTLDGPGVGWSSRVALDHLLSIVGPVLDNGGRVFITIKKSILNGV